ncbi:unnamed protein product [Calicophoron daubneyi]|uniref:UPF0506 domain-containing protein n=1 Tax=Calicophoron daubneyi TaxID=300641 RepID=A0AAV2TRF2_CALDB
MWPNGALAVVIFYAVHLDFSYSCGKIDERCDGSWFFRCCGYLKCELEGFGRGICRECVRNDYPCAIDEHCCSGHCSGFRCMRIEDNWWDDYT